MRHLVLAILYGQTDWYEGGMKLLQNFHILVLSRAHPAYCKMGTGSFPG